MQKVAAWRRNTNPHAKANCGIIEFFSLSQHYCHHAKSLMNKPYHCGFFIKLWDELFKCTYPEDKCFCAECSRAKGERTREAFKSVKIPDYSRLFTLSLWMELVPKSLRMAVAAADD